MTPKAQDNLAILELRRVALIKEAKKHFSTEIKFRNISKSEARKLRNRTNWDEIIFNFLCSENSKVPAIDTWISVTNDYIDTLLSSEEKE